MSLLGTELAAVEFEFSSLENVTINTSALSRAGRNAGYKRNTVSTKVRTSKTDMKAIPKVQNGTGLTYTHNTNTKGYYYRRGGQ